VEAEISGSSQRVEIVLSVGTFRRDLFEGNCRKAKRGKFKTKNADPQKKIADGCRPGKASSSKFLALIGTSRHMIALSWTFYLLSLFQVFQLSETKQKPPDSSHFSILDVTIGQDNLVALQSKLGTGKKCRAREHDGVEIVGYTDSKENLVFEFGEIGGGDVTAFYLSLPSRTTPCPLSRLSTQTSGLVTKGGVHLGMTEQEFVRIFGPPESRSAGGQWKYDWTMDAKYTDEEKKAAAAAGRAVPADTYLIGITVEARFVKGILQYFYISKLAST
jgi:hypothetical protein